MKRFPALPAVILLTRGILSAQALVNPLLPSGADPWVTQRGGFYYYMNTTGSSLTIWKTRNMADLATAEKKVVWRPPATGPYSRDIWAPELHFLRGKWYIYFAADAGTNASHRLWVLENDAGDPLSGEWRMKGKVTDATDRWAIDATVFEETSRLFMIWSGWRADANGTQNLYIAELSDPWTVKGERIMISSPEFSWEKVGDLKPRRDPEENPGSNLLDPLHVDVNEGPEILRHDKQIFLIYSAAGCWTDNYAMGMLTAKAGSNVLDPASWKKNPLPVFARKFLPVTRWDGGLDALPRESGARAGMRESTRAVGTAVHMEGGRHPGFREACRSRCAGRAAVGRVAVDISVCPSLGGACFSLPSERGSD